MVCVLCRACNNGRVYYLGIDFGAKKIGIALSDVQGTIAFPHDIWENDDTLVGKITQLVEDKPIAAIAVGDTRTSDGRANDVTAMLESFLAALRACAAVPIELVPEYGTTLAVRTMRQEGAARGTLEQNKVSHEAPDARAAALILQRFLDTLRA